ncbi:MAG: V-type ATPase subunit [Clostridiales bacterium]|nr:V-type ATPase subunit [Clostridiales bacterium]
MPIKSTHHAVARIKILEDQIVGKDRINRMIEANDADEAFKNLQDSGYGAAAIVESPRDFENMISIELKQLRELMGEISPDEELTDILLMRYDYKNSKAYLKMRMCSLDDDAAVTDAGKIPPRELREMVFQQDTYGLPKHLSDAIDETERQIAIDPNPNKADNIMDRRYISWAIKTAKSKKNEFLISLITAWVDMNNILSLLRVRQMDADVVLLKDALLDGGTLEHKMIIDAYALNDELLSQRFRHTPYGHQLVSAMDQAIEQKRAWTFERFIENMFIAYAKEQKKKVFGMDPIIAYIVAKENEATAIRMVMTGKLNKLDADQIRGRLRELYA